MDNDARDPLYANEMDSRDAEGMEWAYLATRRTGAQSLAASLRETGISASWVRRV